VLCPWTCTLITGVCGFAFMIISFVSSALIIPTMKMTATNFTNVVDFGLSVSSAFMNNTNYVSIPLPSIPGITFNPSSINLSTSSVSAALNSVAFNVTLGNLVPNLNLSLNFSNPIFDTLNTILGFPLGDIPNQFLKFLTD
jgi:hypothetical protein